jgi:hypothetical protein
MSIEERNGRYRRRDPRNAEEYGGNRGMEVEDLKLRTKIETIVRQLLEVVSMSNRILQCSGLLEQTTSEAKQPF